MLTEIRFILLLASMYFPERYVMVLACRYWNYRRASLRTVHKENTIWVTCRLLRGESEAAVVPIVAAKEICLSSSPVMNSTEEHYGLDYFVNC